MTDKPPDPEVVARFTSILRAGEEPNTWSAMMKQVAEDKNCMSDFDGEVPGAGGVCEVGGDDESVPRVPVDQAPAGPALDAAVAIALGKQVKWTDDVVIREPWPIYLAGMTSSSYYNNWKEEEDWREVPKYSTDITAAWELAINSPESDDHVAIYLLSVSRNITLDWWARFGEQPGAIGDTAPLAITRAYLKAKGMEFVEVADESNSD